MNNLLKILITLIVVVNLNADPGKLTSINLSTYTTGSGVLDMSVVGTNLYTVDINSSYKYDINGTLLNTSSVALGNILRVQATTNNAYILQTNSLSVLNTDLNVTIGTYSNVTKTFQAFAMSEDKNYIFIATTTGISIVDISIPSIPVKVGFLETTNAYDVKVRGTYLYVADDWGGLKVIDISNPPIASLSSTSNGTYYKIALENNYLYTLGPAGLSIFDISSAVAPLLKSVYSIAGLDTTASLFVQDMYAYLSGSTDYIYDVSNKSNPVGVIPTNLISNVIMGDGKNIFFGTSGATYKATPDTDYDDNISAATSQTAKSVVNLSSEQGVYGELSNATDIDYIKLALNSGAFIATISGLSDLNVSLYDTNDTNTSPMISVQSNSSTSKTLDLSTEVVSGIHYLKVHSTSGSVGEYKVVSALNADEWTDFKNSALLINLGENLKGNILDVSDVDYFRVDLTSKGNLSFSSVNNEVINIEVENAYDTTVLTGNGDLSEERIYTIPSAGTYFIKIKAFSVDIEDTDYSFRVDFSKSDVLDKEDDALFALKQLNTNQTVSVAFTQVQSEGPYLYVVESSATDILKKRAKSDIATDLATYDSLGVIKNYQIVGDYVYLLTGTGKLEILYKSNLVKRSSISTLFDTGLKINGDYAYSWNTVSNTVVLTDISDKDFPKTLGTTYLDQNIADIDIRTSYDSDTEKMVTYLYAATGSGILVYKVEFTNDGAFLSTLIQTYKATQSFSHIVISNPYAYVSGDNGFSILYIKRPSSSAKLKASLSIPAIDSITINQDFAYLITNDKYLKIIDIQDQTQPKEIDIGAFSAQSIHVENGLGIVAHYSPINLATKIQADTLSLYDMANDYSDVKGDATELKYDIATYGLISQNSPDDIDMFYINATNSMKMNLSASGDINMSYALYQYNTGTLVGTVFNALTATSTTSFDIPGGEYYLQATSSDLNTSGAYAFSVTVLEDDLSDNFTQATSISMDTSYDANISLDDVDMIKIIIEQRGTFTFTTDTNILATLYYDDKATQIGVSSATISQILNPGTYYIKLIANGAYTGAYTFQAHLEQSDDLALPNGFDNIRNFNAQHVVYSPRYIYVINKINKLSIYNHLLQKVEEGPITSGSENNSFLNYCGKAHYYNERIFISTTELNTTSGKYECGKGYNVLELESGDENFYNARFDAYVDYIDVASPVYVTDVSIVGIDNEYVYEFSKVNASIFKTKIADIGYYNYSSKRPYGIFDTTASMDEITFIKNDADIDFIATSNTLSMFRTDPSVPQYDTSTNPDTYLGVDPQVIESNNITFSGDILDIHINRERKFLYVIYANSSILSVIDYSAGISPTALVTDSIALTTSNPTSLFVKDDEIFISFSEYGVKSYAYPLSSSPTARIDAQNIGVDITKPFSYDGTTLNYLSGGNPQVYYLSDTFVDGTTSGTYSVVSDVSEGDGGFEGCFIATASYGNYFSANVKILRDFRDDYLLQNELGRLFVDTYYKYSPSIASEIASSASAKSVVRVLLTPIVYSIKYPLLFLIMLLFLVFCVSARYYMNSKRVVVL